MPEQIGENKNTTYLFCCKMTTVYVRYMIKLQGSSELN